MQGLYALDNCTSDSEGYCEISLSVPSDSEGSFNLSSLEIYLEGKQDIYLGIKTTSDSFDTDDNISLSGWGQGDTVNEFNNSDVSGTLNFSQGENITKYVSLGNSSYATGLTIDVTELP